MNYALPKKLAQLTATDHHRKRSLLTKMKALQEKLDNFTVIDTQGKAVGDVRNLVLHQRQLSLVIVQPDVHRHWRFVSLSSPLVERVSMRDRAVFVRITAVDISYLSDYQAASLSVLHRNNGQGKTKPNAPVGQLPAPLLTDLTQRSEPAKKTTPETSAPCNAPERLHSDQKSPLWEAPATPKVLASAIGHNAPSDQTKSSGPSSNAMPTFSTEKPSAQCSGQRLKIPSTGPRGITTLEPAPIKTIKTTGLDASLQPPVIKGAFTSPNHASQFLTAIAQTMAQRCKTIRLEIELEDATLQGVCQEWLDHYIALSKK